MEIPPKMNRPLDSPLRPEDELQSAPSAIGSADSAEVRPAARPDPRLHYRGYCRPKLADLLAATGLDAPYRAARGASLIDASGEAVTDFVGGFGAALLGHNPPELKRLAVELLESDTPVHAQASNREAAGALASRLSGLMPGNARYVAHFSNSGTEAIEAALKHAYKVHLDRVRHHHEAIARETNELYHQLENRELTAVLPGGKRVVDFRDDLDAHNLEQFESFQKHPVAIAFLGSFHGKTTSALRVTYNHSLRDGFEGLSAIETEFVDPLEPQRLGEIVDARTCAFLRPVVREGEVVLEPAPVTRVFASLLEPIQGEGGIHPMPATTLSWIAEHHKALGLPLIVDEVQTGCGRTGRFFAIEDTPLALDEPEYVVLSKALGGGLVKIGATLIRSDILDHDFGILHTSTFGEDEFSCLIAQRVLDILTREGGRVMDEIRTKGLQLRRGLEGLQAKYPELVGDVRGRGLMLALEFTDLSGQSPFFRVAGRQGFLSILLASYLLRHHQIRVLGPLTNLLNGNPGRVRRAVLRIQPPVVVSEAEMDRLVAALDEALAIVRANDEALLVGHLLGWVPSEAERRAPRSRIDSWPVQADHHEIDGRTAFLIHPTSVANVREYFFPSLRGRPVSEQQLAAWWEQMPRFLEPFHARREVVTSHGFALEVNLVIVPYLPAALAGQGLRRRTQEVRDKIQDAVTIAKELGDDNIPLTVVGLGAYTSVATRSGQTLNDHEMAVTTGNAYTAALTLEGVACAALGSGVDLTRAKVAVVGAGGNIGQILSVFLAGSCASLVLLGSSRSDAHTRLKSTREACLESLRRGEVGCGSPLPSRTGQPACDISCENDAAVLRECDVIIVTTSSPDRELLTPDQLKPGAIVCCTSLPSNLSTAFQAQANGIVAFDAGLARLPEDARLDFVGLPTDGLAYGCLAETLLLGFDGHNHSFSKGPVTVAQVQRTWAMAARHGFALSAFQLGGRYLPDRSRTGHVPA
jgi:acetylornithine/succinyldiaminopimelate/putrescine aminotransferase/predicted amino acid dehydrogenase